MDINSERMRVSSSKDINLLLFPEETLELSVSSQSCDAQQPPATLPAEASSLPIADVLTEWQPMLKRLGRRRRVLETILAAGRPIRLFERTLVVGFSPQRRFHRELLDLPEYRRCVEEELSKIFGLELQVVTVLHPERSGPGHKGRFGQTPA
jgi:hypothetical protein